MTKRFSLGCVMLALGMGSLGGTGCNKKAKPAGTEPETKAVSFAGEIMPVFVRSCGVCHKREDGNEAAVKNQKYYELPQDVLGAIGKFIIPGKPEESGLIKVCDQTYPVGEKKIVMPPPRSDAPKWTDEELVLLTKWIEQGALDN